MPRGNGGAIKNWRKVNGKLFWRHRKKNIAMRIGKKQAKGYPVYLFGSDVRNDKKYLPTKRKAKKFSADWRRKLI